MNATESSLDDPTLFELVATFRVIDAITAVGWTTQPLRLWQGALQLRAQRGKERLTLHYQHTPKALSRGSHYAAVQKARGCSISTCRYFTSSYSTALYYYDRRTCSQWNGLSRTYLRGLKTAAALRQHYKRVLHPAC